MALIASLISCADGGQTVEPAVENAPRLALKLVYKSCRHASALLSLWRIDAILNAT